MLRTKPKISEIAQRERGMNEVRQVPQNNLQSNQSRLWSRAKESKAGKEVIRFVMLTFK